MTDEAPRLRHVFTIRADVATSVELERRSSERLEFIPITGGTVDGPRLRGTVRPGGGDWCLERSDDTFRVEARYLVTTEDGAVVDVHNVGYLRHLDGHGGDWQDMGYFLCTPVFRTAAPDLQWLTRTVFVGRARAGAEQTVVSVFEVLP